MQKVLPNYLCYFSKENDKGTIYQFYYLKKKITNGRSNKCN